MKPFNHIRLLVALSFMATGGLLAGQTTCGAAYARMVAEGDALFKAGKYKDAFEKYRAARGCTEAVQQVLDQKVEDVLQGVDNERLKADRSAAAARTQQKKAEKALREAEIEKSRAKAAEKKANEVLDKIYFYEDRYGLAYSGGHYGFIDKDLKTRIEFAYSEAMPFDYTGYAWVKRGNFEQFMLDTLGHEHPLAYDVSEIKETTTALDLRNRSLDSLPAELFQHTQLKILMLSGNQLKTLPSELGRLQNLVFLGLSRNELVALPAEIGNLPNLMVLQVFQNHLETLPPQILSLKRLNVLDVQHNNMSHLSLDFTQLKSLKSLDLRNNPLDKTALQGLRSKMKGCALKF